MIGLVATLSGVPGWTGHMFNSTWLALAGALPFFIWKPVRMTWAHYAGIAFIVYASASLFWTPRLENGKFELFCFFVLAMAFIYGSTTNNSSSVYRGLGIGGSVGGFLALAQWLGLDWPDQNMIPGGLLGNASTLAQTSAIILCLAVGEGLWWAVPGCALGVLLGGSRAAYVAIGLCCLLWRGPIWLRVSLSMALLIGACVTALGKADDLRLEIWSELLRYPSFFGFGLGSFSYQTSRGFALHAHNDYFELISEIGIGTVFAYATLVLCIECANRTERAVLLCFAVIAFFAFPLYVPTSAFVAAFVAGRAASRRAVVQPQFLLPRRSLHQTMEA